MVRLIIIAGISTIIESPFFITDTAEVLPRSKVERDMNTTPVFLAIIIAGISTIAFSEGKLVSTGKYSVWGKSRSIQSK